jgi:hypothetical protein
VGAKELEGLIRRHRLRDRDSHCSVAFADMAAIFDMQKVAV